MILSIEHLTKTFGNITALDNVSITFVDGIYGILGANGSGKSTMLSIITDTLKRDKGEIKLDGQDILDMGIHYRHMVGYLPQKQGFYEHLSITAFLLYMAKLKGFKKKEAIDTIEALLEVVNLQDSKDKSMGSLSGGMRQRALIASALLGDPKLIYLDEPTAGLDIHERINLRNYISTLSKEKIILWTTHLTEDIEEIADHFVIMKQGTIVVQGTLESMKNDANINKELISLEDIYKFYVNGNAKKT